MNTLKGQDYRMIKKTLILRKRTENRMEDYQILNGYKIMVPVHSKILLWYKEKLN